jgi:hypothetical protein
MPEMSHMMLLRRHDRPMRENWAQFFTESWKKHLRNSVNMWQARLCTLFVIGTHNGEKSHMHNCPKVPFPIFQMEFFTVLLQWQLSDELHLLKPSL